MTALPEWGKSSLEMYVKYGRPTGGFLRAVLSNDLMESFGRADEDSRSYLFEYASYIYNKTPMNCHGSYERYEDWIKSGGLEGQASSESVK